MSELRTLLKFVMPNDVFFLLKRLKDKVKTSNSCAGFCLMLGYIRQWNQFMKTAAFPKNSGKSQIEARMQYHTHEIEKGLSHKDFRAGFGKNALTQLFIALSQWDGAGYSWQEFVPQHALAVVKAYREKHEQLGVELPFFFRQSENRFNSLLSSIEVSDSGVAEYTHQQRHGLRSYSQVLEERVSLRDYSSEPVDVSLLEGAGKIAMRAPSVCNRQSPRLYVIQNQNKLRRSMEIQAGMYGYEKPPALLLITARVSSFLDATERNEPYVDGGLFSMALLGALEEADLAACPLNTMFDRKREKAIRELLDIPEDEVLIMFVAVGHKLERALHPQSARRPINDIMTFVK